LSHAEELAWWLAVVLLIARGLSHTLNYPISGPKWDSLLEPLPRGRLLLGRHPSSSGIRLGSGSLGSGSLLAPPPFCGRGSRLGLSLDRLCATALLAQA